jgi:hypothetical protein
MIRMKRLATMLLGLVLLVSGLPALAQEAGRRGAAPEARSSEPGAAGFRLPAPVVTHQVLELPGRTLRFTATVGAIRQYDLSGNPYAEIFYVAYQLENPPARRPVLGWASSLPTRRCAFSAAIWAGAISAAPILS